jgi:hypothetical protein
MKSLFHVAATLVNEHKTGGIERSAHFLFDTE